MELFVCCAIVPATWVPCPSQVHGERIVVDEVERVHDPVISHQVRDDCEAERNFADQRAREHKRVGHCIGTGVDDRDDDIVSGAGMICQANGRLIASKFHRSG